MLSAPEALQLLKDGNARFVEHVPSAAILTTRRRAELLETQRPFAVILGCSDSRAPAELVFDQGLGDLFVIRVAGNIVAPSQIGSVEFAVERFGTRLVVVMGHTKCGAVTATLDSILQPDESASRNLLSIVQRIRPAVESLVDVEGGPPPDPAALLRRAVKANVRASANQLVRGSAILEDAVENRGLVVMEAIYELETGKVDFFGQLPLLTAPSKRPGTRTHPTD